MSYELPPPADIKKCRLLAEGIIACLGDGIDIDHHTRHYIDACFLGITLEEVGRRINDNPDINDAPLLELIFFPDRSFQVRLEPLLEKDTYDIHDETEVVSLLQIRPILTTLREPESRKTTSIQVPASVLPPFVRRLGITRRIPARLAGVISDIHTPDRVLLLKVALRNTRFPFSQPFIAFLDAFLRGMGSGDKDFDACFELILTTLEIQGSETDPFKLLQKKTDTFLRAREAAALFEKQLRRNNMETLMQQGVRAPEISVSEADEKIALLDRIGKAVASVLGSF